ncbi:Polar amino acid transport system permease protein OS=Castellaniella defragrans OX=75697 GN=HNR28_000822 PE=3 SV=1 [Castellaniella defragrans]
MQGLSLLWQYRFDILHGIGWTVQIAVGAALVALILAFVAGLGRLSSWRPLRAIASVYIEFFRGTSALSQLFWLFFVLPYLGISLSPRLCAVVGLGLCFGAYGAEVVRGAFEAIPRSQRDALAALNFGRLAGFRTILLPQAMILITPLFSNLAIELLKSTSLASLITIPDLTFQAHAIVNRSYDAGPIYLFTAIVYLILAQTIARSMRRLEAHLGRGLHPAAATRSRA